MVDNQNAVGLTSLVRQIVGDTLRSSAPGLSGQMRQAIVNSISVKLDHALMRPTPIEDKE